MLELKSEIQKKVHYRISINKQTRLFFLRQQMKVLQTELGEEVRKKRWRDLRARGDLKKLWNQEVHNHFESIAE